MKTLWRIRRIVAISLTVVVVIVVSLGVLVILSKYIQYYFFWYFMVTSVISYVVTDYVDKSFERIGNKWKTYKRLRLAFFFVGIVAAAEAAAFLSVGYSKALNSAEIGAVILVLTIIAIVLPWRYLKWRDKAEEKDRTTGKVVSAAHP